MIDKEYDLEKNLNYEALKEIFMEITSPPAPLLQERGVDIEKSFEKNNDIRVKLSYPNKKTALVAKQAKIYDIKVENSKLFVDNKEVKIFEIKSPESKITPYLEIISWDRKPTWDKSGIYNDNKFR